MKQSKWDFDKALGIEPAYTPDERFHEAFWGFADGLASLQRFFSFGHAFVGDYLEVSRGSLGQQVEAASFDVHSDMTLSDEERFELYFSAATLSHLFALVETLLSEVVSEFEEELGLSVADMKRMPYINQHLAFLQRPCGLPIEIEKTVWKRLDVIRAARNKFVHDLARDLPEDILEQINGLISAEQPPQMLSLALVEAGFETMASIATALEEAYWAKR